MKIKFNNRYGVLNIPYIENYMMSYNKSNSINNLIDGKIKKNKNKIKIVDKIDEIDEIEFEKIEKELSTILCNSKNTNYPSLFIV